MATHADRLQQTWTRLSEHLNQHPHCAKAYAAGQVDHLCGEGWEAFIAHRYEQLIELEEQAAEPVSSDEVIEVHERLKRDETLDDLLHPI